MFGFATAAGLAFLTLIPAIRRGGAYLKGNGSPWRWPLYPWSLFFFLGLGVCGRSYYLCISLHNVEGYSSIFGPYFLVPFGFAIAALLLEAGLTSGRGGVTRFALAVPLGLVALAMVGHRPDPVYERFLAIFQRGLGVAPPAATLLLALGFYGVAAWRAVPMARGWRWPRWWRWPWSGRRRSTLRAWVAPSAWPLAAGRPWCRDGWRSAGASRGGGCSPRPAWWRRWRACRGLVVGRPRAAVAAAHLAVVALLALGAVFRDELAGSAPELRGDRPAPGRAGGPGGRSPPGRRGLPRLARGLTRWRSRRWRPGTGWSVGGWAFFGVAGAIVAAILLMFGSKWYFLVRRQVHGLDRIMLGLASFGVAAFISLWKSGLLPSRGAGKPRPSRIDPDLAAEGPGG